MDVILAKNEVSNKPLAYLSRAIDLACIKKEVNNCNHEKEYRGKPLTKDQQQRSRWKSKRKARFQRIFAFMALYKELLNINRIKNNFVYFLKKK